MSLLHTALKKAEKEGNVAPGGARMDVEEPQPLFSLKAYVLVSIAVTLLIGTVYFRFLRKQNSFSPQPATFQTPAGLSGGVSVKQLTEEGTKFFQAGQFEEAHTRFEKVVMLEPRNVEGYSNLGLVLKTMGKNEEAFEQYRKALSIDPQCAECLNNLGVLYLSNRELDEAEPNFQKAIQVKSDYADPYFHLGLLQEARGDLTSAKKSYQKFVELAHNVNADLLLKVQERMAAIQEP